MGALMRAFAWATSPFGPVSEWPPSLRMVVRLCLSSHFPTVVFWGPELYMLYNDASLPILDDRHPASLGRAARDVWPDIWPIVGPMLHSVLATGEATRSQDLLLPIVSHNTVIERYFTVSYSPIQDEKTGQVLGVFCPVTETTERVERERQEHAWRREAEAAHARVYTTLESIADGFYTVDSEWRFTYINSRAQAIWQGLHADMLGRRIWDEFPEAERLIFGQQLHRAMRERVTVSFAGYYPAWDTWLDVRAYPSAEGLAVYFQDITARKKAEAALAESEARLSTIVNAMPAYVYLLDTDNRYLYINRYFENNFHVQNEAIRGQPITAVFPPDIAQALTAHNERAVREQQTLESEEQVPLPDGGLHTFYTVKTPWYDAAGALRGVVGISIDVTARKAAERALREQEGFLRTLGDNLVEGSLFQYVIDPDGRAYFSYMSAGIERLIGIAPAAILADPEALFARYLPQEQERLRQLIQESARHGTAIDTEACYLGPTGDTRWMLIRAHPHREATGAMVWEGISLDITERKQAEHVVVQQARALARTYADLRQVAYVSAHDLQEPIRQIGIYTQLIAKQYRDSAEAGIQEALTFILEGTKRMQAQFTDLLHYLEIEEPYSGMEDTNCELLLQQVLDWLHEAISTSGATITHDPLPIVEANKEHLRLVFRELLDNAIKFRTSAPPRIHIWAERETYAWRFAIRDNGIGIDAEAVGQLFGFFRKLHPRTTYSGTGMGLAICKKIVDRHGGHIWMDSTPGQGTTVYFTLHQKQP